MSEPTKVQRRAFPALAPFYAQVLPLIVQIGRAHGYAIAAHGSLATDFDVVAVPWAEKAAPPLNLILAIKADLGAFSMSEWGDYYFKDCSPTKKPHGRVAYSLHLTNNGCNGPYLDVSVMPRLP